MEGAAAAKCGRGLHGYGLAAWGVPLGGQMGMAVSRQGGREGRRWRLPSLHPCLLTAMGGQGGLKGGLTNFLQSAIAD